MRIIDNDQKNNGQNFWEILKRIIGKISSIIGAGLLRMKTALHSTYTYTRLGAGHSYYNRLLFMVLTFATMIKIGQLQSKCLTHYDLSWQCILH